MKKPYSAFLIAGIIASVFWVTNAHSASPVDTIINSLAAITKQNDANFKGFSSKRGQRLYMSTNTGGKPATPSCTTCHSTSPVNAGKTRAGKLIEPMALSKTPNRFSDPKKVAKWFRRNCKSVLGRECSAVEKGDYLTFLTQQ